MAGIKSLKLAFLLFFVLFLSYLVYPGWLVYGDEGVFYYGVVVGVTLLCVYLATRFSVFVSSGGKGGDLFFIWLVLFLVLFLSHAVVMSKPLTGPTDEDYHIGRAAYVFKPIENFLKLRTGGFYPYLGFSVFVFIVVGFFILKRLFTLEKVGSFGEKHFWKIIGACVVFAVILFVFLNHNMDAIVSMQHPDSSYKPDFWTLIRYGPLYLYPYAGMLFLFDYHLFFIRLVQVCLVSLSSLYIYRILFFLSKRREVAWFGSLAYLFLPSVFYYSSMAFLDPGMDFFSVASVYYFLQYLEYKKPQDAYCISLLFITGFFYKDYVVLLYGLMIGFLILSEWILRKRVSLDIVKDHQHLFGSFLVFVLAILPWLVTAKEKGVYYYGLHVLDFFSMFTVKMFGYLISALSWPVFILFVAGFLYAVGRGKKELVFLAAWFIVFFLFHAMHIIWNKDIHRYSLHYTVPAVLLASWLMFSLIPRKRGVLRFVPWIVLIFLSGSTLFAAYSRMDDRYLPFDESYKALVGVMQPGERAILIGLRSATYMAKYDLNWDNVVFFDFSSYSKPVEEQSLDNLYNISIAINASYVVTADDHPAYGLSLFAPDPYIWGNEGLYLKEGFIRSLVRNKDVRFCLMKRISSGVNRVYLFRVAPRGKSLKNCLKVGNE